MNDAFKLQIAHAVEDGNIDKVLALIEHQYEFKCPAFIMAGPGHQSKHTCDRHRPHALADEHFNDMYSWTGSASIVDGKVKNNPEPY